MKKRFGAIAVAGCVCGLLFSGAASARQTADSITVTGVVLGPAANGTYVQFSTGNSAPYGDGSPFKQITFSGGSNFHFAGIDGAGGNCKLTPANGGISCTAAPDFSVLPNIWLNTIISGTLPAAVTGTVVYGDNSTGTFTAPVTEGPPSTYGGGVGAVVKGTSIQISVRNTLPPIVQFTLDGGNDWHVTAISTPAGSCRLTPSNGGGSCALAKAVTDFVVTATFSGQPPNFLSGQMTGADNFTFRWSWELHCYCKKLSAQLTGFKQENHGHKLVFFLKWKLDCSAGTTGGSFCGGFINLKRPGLPPGLEVRQGRGAKPWPRKTRIKVRCPNGPGNVGARCGGTVEGKYQLELVGPATDRAQQTISFLTGIYCGGIMKNKKTELFTLKFDRNGNLNRHKSHLGNLT
jgi:hypothetical protein